MSKPPISGFRVAFWTAIATVTAYVVRWLMLIALGVIVLMAIGLYAAWRQSNG